MFGIKNLLARVSNLWIHVDRNTRAIEELRSALRHLKGEHAFVANEFDKVRTRVIKHDKAAGGFWRTASGYTMRVRDMSTDHIKRCLAGNFGGPGARKNLEIEQARRKEEDYWRSQPMPGEKEPESTTVYAYVGRIYGTPIYVPNDTGFEETVNIGNILRRHGL